MTFHEWQVKFIKPVHKHGVIRLLPWKPLQTQVYLDLSFCPMPFIELQFSD